MDAWRNDDRAAERWHISSTQSWKIEAQHLAKRCQNQSGNLDTRWSIDDTSYWRTETFHYNDLLGKLGPAQRLKEKPQNSSLERSIGDKKRKRSAQTASNERTGGFPASQYSWLARWRAANESYCGTTLQGRESATIHKRRKVIDAMANESSCLAIS